MSMQPGPWPEVPEGTARVARLAFRKGSLAMRVRDELGAWCADGDFAAGYGVRGRPGISPAQLAVVTVLQFAENMTDRQAADAVRGRLDWKYCLGLELEDGGFDFSVLSEFRGRLVAGSLETAVLDRLLERCGELGLVRAGGPQRTDSTHVLGRIRALNRLELAGETVRAALEALAAAAPGWLGAVIDESWQEVYGQRIDALRLPASDAGRQELAVRYGQDGYRLLDAVRAPGAPPWLRELPAVEALRAVWVQQYYRDISARGEKVIRREPGEHGLPPGHLLIQSPYDTDVRYSEKRGKGWRGYKVHLSETCPGPAGDDPETGRPQVPNLVTDVTTTAATVPDIAMTEPVHDKLAARDLTPGEHAADTGYISADLLLAARARGITLIGPVLADTSPQARTGRYTAGQFTIDWDNQHVTCPQGQTSTSWRPGRQQNTDVNVVRFATATCKACPARGQCTTSRTGRMLTLRTRQAHDALTTARAAQDSAQWKARYKIRAGIEGTISQATHVTGIRRARYLGLPKTSLEHNIAATAINLIRLDAWWTSTPLDRTHTTHLQRLQLAPAA
ncbi:MAG TPA: IS1182 family transposase [Streptosporangiaceae bacterium]|nr:IS1182 family transposase [Streptosporangiaceae bacterium]